MNKEEAINVLNDYDINFEGHTPEEVAEAHEMAIKAIFRTIPNENEQIIRINKGTLKARTGKYVIYDVEWLKEHFNTTEAKIYGQQGERTEERTEMHACDCINRKEAIDALKQQAEKMSHWSERYAEQRKGVLTAINVVSDCPSVTPQPKEEPQQKTGHWIKHKHNGKPYFKCSECLYFAPIGYSYCPGCGAKMQEAK